MKLTKISNDNINCVFENNSCKKELTKRMKNYYFMKLLYTFIERATNESIFIKIKEITEIISYPINEFIDNEIKKYIDTTTFKKYKIEIKIRDKLFIIYINTVKTIDISKIIYFFKIILYICTVNTCHKETKFTFNLFFTDFKKTEPQNIVEQKNINSGYTVNYKYIVIYRLEELYKVFIHECFHLFCLDFSNVKGINYKEMFEPLFQVKSEFLLFECFCEYWARTLNAAIVAYHSKKNIIYKEFQIAFELNINVERCFSLLQLNHFLKTMNLTYLELIEGRGKDIYRENTNGICYYVLTALLMYNFEQTMNWFIDNNETIINFTKTNDNIYLFYLFIKLIYNQPEILNVLKSISKENKEIPTMHMAALEISVE
jgi:hypothetical protein